MRSFQDLKVWQEAHRFVLQIYNVTKNFPNDERFGLISQMRRASVSIPANIAEGFHRRGIRDKLRFYNISEASLEEVKYYLILSADLGYLQNRAALSQQADLVGRLLNGFIQSTERRL